MNSPQMEIMNPRLRDNNLFDHPLEVILVLLEFPG